MEYGGYARIPSGSLIPLLKNSKTYSFAYNALGQRVTSHFTHFFSAGTITPVTTGEVVEYTKAYSYDHSGRLISESITEERYGEGSVYSNIVFLYDESSMVGFEYTTAAGTNIYYYLRNLQGDVIGIYDSYGNKVVEYAYDAWGNCTIKSTTTNYTVAHANPIRYRGYYYDEDTKLYYLNSRYYCPEWRRFISPDDTSYLDPETPNGLNLYCYCNNDPVNYADPNGHSAFLIAMSALAVAGLITTGIGVAIDNNLITAIGLTAVAAPALISGGLALSLLTPVGFGIGATTIVAGAGTALFASAEYQEAFTDNNWMLDAGMSEAAYNALMQTTAAIATLGTVASSVAYSFNINTITEIGKIRGSDFKGIKFTQIKNGKKVYRSLEFHHGHSHKGHKLHWQLNKWSPAGNSLRGGTAWWTIWLKRIP